MESLRSQDNSTTAARIALSVGALIYGVVVPILELNRTHVWDPLWPAHARLHEVWQLVTNTAFAAVSLGWIWAQRRVRMPILVAALITGGFLVAYVLRDAYGGSMVLSNGTEKRLAGLNLGALGFSLVNVLSALAWFSARRASRSRSG
jgi:hypothetical protein